MIESLQKEIDKVTDQMDILFKEQAIARAEKDEKEMQKLQTLIMEKMNYREGLVKAKQIVRNYKEMN